jgi:hypothetical protein
MRRCTGALIQRIRFLNWSSWAQNELKVGGKDAQNRFEVPPKKSQIAERDITLVSISGPYPSHDSHCHLQEAPPVNKKETTRTKRRKAKTRYNAAIRSESTQWVAKVRFRALQRKELYLHTKIFIPCIIGYGRLGGLVVRVLGYRSRGPGSFPGTKLTNYKELSTTREATWC